MRTVLVAALLALGCGGEVEPVDEQPLCAWEEPLKGECARFTGPALSLEGRSCEPVSCLVVPFGRNDGTLQQVEASEGADMDTGPCSELLCP